MNDLSIQEIDSRLTVLFQSDELAAHEYQKTFEKVRPLQPERRLMLAVLEDAIMCLQRYLHAKGGKEQKLHEDAVSWIFDESDNGVFCFENVCEVCGLDPDYLRMGLLKWRKQTNPVNALCARVPPAPRKAMRQRKMRGDKR